MINKDATYKWDKREKYAFICIKQAIEKPLALYSPNFSKYFLLCIFTFDTSLAIILTQKDDQDKEQPISFMSVRLQGPELNYPAINKHAYVVYKAVKHFRPYLLNNHVIIFMPHPIVRSLFVQQELDERKVNLMTKLQEYDIEVKLVHTINGHGPCKLATKATSSPKDDSL